MKQGKQEWHKLLSIARESHQDSKEKVSKRVVLTSCQAQHEAVIRAVESGAGELLEQQNKAKQWGALTKCQDKSKGIIKKAK
jgi:hypothetical protein